MSADPEIVVLPSAELVAAAAAARLITAVVDAQAARGVASVVLTGGGVGGTTLRAVRDSPARDAVDWSRVDVWWGDERWLPAGDPERNDKQAQDALLSAVPVDPARVHPFAAADGAYAGDLAAAAAAYAAELATAARFDVLMLGVGEEGHVASIFPDSPAAHATEPVVAVHGCPKPPPDRLTLTFPTIGTATEVWLLTAGAAKAEAIATSLSGAAPVDLPAAGARGTTRTLYLLDRAAAAKLP